MADLTPLGFDPAKTETVSAFTVIPPGIYTVVAINSEVKDTKNKDGKTLEITYQIVDGSCVGSELVDRINIVNKSEMAQKIGLSQLKDICDAVGHVGILNDSAKLHGKPFSVKVIVEDFKSNKQDAHGEYKTLKSNKIDKRMAKQSPTVSGESSSSGGAAQAPGKSKW